MYGTQSPLAEADVPTRRRHAILEGSDRVPSVDEPVARKPSGQRRLQETTALPTRVEVLAELSRTSGAVGDGCRSVWSGADVEPARPAAHWTATGALTAEHSSPMLSDQQLEESVGHQFVQRQELPVGLDDPAKIG